MHGSADGIRGAVLPQYHRARQGVRRTAALLSAGSLLTACTLLSGCTLLPGGADRSGAGAPGPEAQAPPPPPPPPAACLLDISTLAADTGVAWAPDPTTASDTRCVYDPAGADDTTFVAVDVAPFTAPDTATALETLAQPCADGTRGPAGELGFVCRFPGGNVFAALVRGQQVITLAASSVPPSTTAERLAAAFTKQVDALR